MKGEYIVGEYVKLQAEGLEKIHEANPRLVSYNVEMTEVTGGTFWKAYTDAQIDGTEQVPPPDFSKGMGAMHQWYDPIDTTNPRLIKLAKELGSSWVRVSGTWATKTYYDFDGISNKDIELKDGKLNISGSSFKSNAPRRVTQSGMVIVVRFSQ